jgi:hypothetical protein
MYSRMKEKDDVYKMSLNKGMIIFIGELEKGDIAFIRKWLNRIEATMQSDVQKETKEAEPQPDWSGEGLA